MNIAPPNPSASVAALFTQVLLPFLPSSERQSVEQELPTLALLAHQLGVDVLVAEQQGLPYGEAVKRPEFLKMGRVYYGACNLLQYQLPPRDAQGTEYHAYACDSWQVRADAEDAVCDCKPTG